MSYLEDKKRLRNERNTNYRQFSPYLARQLLLFVKHEFFFLFCLVLPFAVYIQPIYSQMLSVTIITQKNEAKNNCFPFGFMLSVHNIHTIACRTCYCPSRYTHKHNRIKRKKWKHKTEKKGKDITKWKRGDNSKFPSINYGKCACTTDENNKRTKGNLSSGHKHKYIKYDQRFLWPKIIKETKKPFPSYNNGHTGPFYRFVIATQFLLQSKRFGPLWWSLRWTSLAGLFLCVCVCV